MSVRVRFAPSPTGYLHVGGARTALYDYLYAKKHGGTFILRIEDTDRERSTEDALKKQIQDLHWLGLKWDEGPDPVTLKDSGEYGPYKQSDRLEIYKKYADQLLESGNAYYCFLTDEEISTQREAAIAAGRPPQVKSPYREWSLEKGQEEFKKNNNAVVRFKIPDKKTDYKFNDLVRGDVTFPSDMVGDFVLLRSGGMPVYNFCCVIDDALMKMSHVFRAEEHLSNTLRQLMIYEALGFDIPKFGHVSIILGSDRQKLSKRHGATSVGQYKEMGYLPEAMNNFLSLLGWSSPNGDEIMQMKDLESQFDSDRLNSSPAVFDEDKLRWFNATHLRALPHKELWSRVKPFLDKEDFVFPDSEEWQSNSLEVFKSSMEVLCDAVELYRPLSLTTGSDSGFKVLNEAADVLKWEETKKVLAVWTSELEKATSEYLTEDDFSNIQNTVKAEAEVKGKHLFMPIRTAILGKPHGAELKQVVPLISRQELLTRAKAVVGQLA